MTTDDDFHALVFDPEQLKRYDASGPRYTSYPTAVQFHSDFTAEDYQAACARSQAQDVLPLSLYFHLPFCDTVCYYCACNKVITKNRNRAAPYLARLHRELALQGALFDPQRQVEQLHWGGGTPTFISHDEMRALMAETRRHFSLCDDDSGEYSIEIDPREVGTDTVALLRELGFNRMSLGVQDFDPVVQRAVNRIQSQEQTLSVLEAARQEGFRSLSLDLIYGLPHQSVESFARTLDTVIAMDPDRLSVFNYAHLPTLFKSQRQIHAADLPSPAEKLAILRHTIERLTGAGYVYIGMDHFARPTDELAIAQREGGLYRNFQGYSTHAECDLVGLGVTAIGRVADTYSQNERGIEQYYARIDADQIPIFRGLRLDEDDCLRREVISQLMCHFKLDAGNIESRFGIDFAQYFATELDRLQPMEQDGLLHRDAHGLQVLPAGKLLIRNISMVFDRYLPPAEPHDATQGPSRFSRVI